jgi:hypothetical protein
VALQGTLDTFALPDVLRLLAATKKSGSLRLTSEQGAGTVGFDDGAVRIVRADHVSHATEPVDALFELLRFEHGTFTFDAEVPAEPGGDRVDVEELLVAAEALLAEWREIAAVVPAMGAWVTLRRTLDADSVTVPSAQWSTLVAVGSGATVAAIAAELGLTELPVSRAVRDLHSLGVVDIDTEAPMPVTEPPSAALPVEPAPVEPLSDVDAPPELHAAAVSDECADEPADLDSEPEDAGAPDAVEQAWGAAAPIAPRLARPAALEDPDAPLPTARPLRARRPRHLSPGDEASAEPETFVPLDLPGAGPARTYDEPSEDDAEDLDSLTAAFPGLAGQGDDDVASDAATGEEPGEGAGAPEVEAGADDEHVNRGVLLKFLSSVKS